LVLALGNDCYITNVISFVAVIGDKILIFEVMNGCERRGESNRINGGVLRTY